MAQLDLKCSGRMGVRALVYYLVTTILAAFVGIVMVLAIHPGDPNNKSLHHHTYKEEIKISTIDALLDIVRFNYFLYHYFDLQIKAVLVDDLMKSSIARFVRLSIVFRSKEKKFRVIFRIFRNMMPENLVQACFQQVQTTYTKKPVIVYGVSNEEEEFVMEHSLVYKDGTNVMGMIVFCITFGLIVGQIGPRGKVMIDFFTVLNDIIMKLVNIIILW